MFFIHALLAGGVLYAGLKAYQDNKKSQEAASKQEKIDLPQATPTLKEKNPREVLDDAKHYLSVSSFSLGLAASGSLIYRPLIFASIPATIYVTLPIFQKSYHTFFNGKSERIAVLNSLAVIGALGTGHYFIPSFLDWSYHFVRKNWLQTKNNLREAMITLGRKTQYVWVRLEEGEVEIPRQELNLGDIIVVSQNEIIPIGGTIIDGTASIGQYFITGQSEPVEKSIGEQVFPASYVLSGKVYIRVEKLTV